MAWHNSKEKQSSYQTKSTLLIDYIKKDEDTISPKGEINTSDSRINAMTP